eukprot:s4426_g1.t1
MHGLRVTASAPNTASFSCYFQQNVLILTTCDTAQLATQASLTKTVSGRQKREAERFAFQASQLRAQAEAFERKARACHSEGGRLARRLQAAESGLRVRIVSARGLRAADFNLMNWGTSDPFCTCEVVGQPGASFKTHVIDKCLDPCWDFEGKFPNYKVKIVGGKHLLEAYSGVLGRTLELTVKGSKIWTACNLYCKCEIPGRPMASFTSQTVEHSEFPEWNYERRIAAYKPGDLLHFTIFNESRGSKDLALATCKVASDMFHPGGFAGTVELQVADEPGWAPNAAPLRQLKQQIETSETPSCMFSSRSLGPSSIGYSGVAFRLRQKPVLELRISDSAGRYPKTAAAESSKLQVRILSGRGLKASDSYLVGEATSDPYCTCEVQGRATSRFRSQTIERSLAPQWNYQHRVRGYQEGDALKFTDYMSEDDFLGSAVLEAKAFREKGFVGELRLDTGDEKDQSFIKVAVSDREGNFSEPLDLGAKVVLEAGGLLRQLGSLLCSRANWFKILIGAVICINTVWLLVQSVFPYWRDRLWYLDPVFLVVYCLETGLRMGHWRLQFFSHPHEAGWNWFDLIIVLAGVLEEIETFSDDEKDGSGTGTQLMALRVFKPLRLVARLARFMRVVRLLRVLLTADFSWVESATFQSAVGVVILLNAVIMGLETDIQSPIWEWAEQIMLSFFVLEAVLRVRRGIGLDFVLRGCMSC